MLCMPTKVERREHFASTFAEQLASHIDPTAQPALRRGPWTKQAVWFDAADELIAVVGPQEGKDAGSLLARGLFHRGAGRALHLVLDRKQSGATHLRRPWFDDVRLSVYDVSGVDGEGHDVIDATSTALVPPISIQKAVSRSGGFEPTPPPSWESTRAAVLRPLVDWVLGHAELVPAHRQGYRSWHAYGHTVLKVESKGRGFTVTAGLNQSTARAARHHVSAPIDDEVLAQITRAVEVGIKQAMASAKERYREHLLQAWLRREPWVLGLEPPLLRELPVKRPKNVLDEDQTGSGFIDLVGVDPLGAIVLVETKVGDDHMLGLQALDYWAWAQRAENREFLERRLHVRPGAPMRIVLAVAGKGGKAPRVDAYTGATLAALPREVQLTLALVDRWPEDPENHSFVSRRDDVMMLAPGRLTRT